MSHAFAGRIETGVDVGRLLVLLVVGNRAGSSPVGAEKQRFVSGGRLALSQTFFVAFTYCIKKEKATGRPKIYLQQMLETLV